MFRYCFQSLVATTMVLAAANVSAGIASVDFANGGVEAINAAGVSRILNKGATIDSGDTVQTTAAGRAQLRFSDGAMVSLQPDTAFRVDNYRLNTTAPEDSKGFFSLLKGGLRTITGLIGRSNRENYRVTTSVATIGIRGTEYSALLGPGGNGLALATGEGAIEVCNGAGCLILASGESGFVSGRNNEPKRTEFRPRLPPAAPIGSVLPVFSTAETRSPDGSVAPVSTPLPSGGGYQIAWHSNSGPSAWPATAGTAVFGTASDLFQFNTSSNVFAASSVDENFSDGPLGWGHWATMVKDGSSTYGNTHYVVGTPTSTPDLTALSGITATYSLIGYTSATSAAGKVSTGPLTGSLTASFSGGTLSSGSVAINVPIGSSIYALAGALTSSGGPNFYAYPTCGLCGAGSSLTGFFAGAGASHAGVSYMFRDSASTPITGAAAFRR